METNIDDITGEVLGFVMELLLTHSLDVFYTPIYMKKNRPAYKLSVLYENEKEEEILDIIFQHTTTIGVRKYEVERTILERKIINFFSSFGEVRLKAVSHKNREYIYPEYESLKEILRTKNISFMELYHQVVEEYKNSN